MTWQDRICVDPNICHGKACIWGTWVMVSVILDNVATGEDYAEIAKAYNVEEAGIQAASHYPPESARERNVPLTAASG